MIPDEARTAIARYYDRVAAELAEAIAERDRARDAAVKLEQELAEARDELAALLKELRRQRRVRDIEQRMLRKAAEIIGRLAEPDIVCHNPPQEETP